MNSGKSTASSVRKILRPFRDLWIALGVGVLGLVTLEFAWRSVATFNRPTRAALSKALPPNHPYTDSAWYLQLRANRAPYYFRWEPFAYYRGSPIAGRYLTIDSAGLRVTPRFAHPGGRPLRVFFLGGSTTWGYEERDSSTRPAQVARQLSAAGFGPDVVNLAQPGYTSAQELVTLTMELRRGNVPDVVVSWDGENDVNAMRQNGRPGLSYREFERVEDAALNTKRRGTGGSTSVSRCDRSLCNRWCFVGSSPTLSGPLRFHPCRRLSHSATT